MQRVKDAALLSLAEPTFVAKSGNSEIGGVCVWQAKVAFRPMLF